MHVRNEAKGGGKKGAARQAKGGKGKGTQPPDLSGAQATVEHNMWMVQEAKDRAEWFLSYFRGKPDVRTIFERITDEMAVLGIPEGEGDGQNRAPADPGGNGGKGNVGGGRPVKEKPLEIQIRDIDAKQ